MSAALACDCLIVGGGPAGSSLAFLLARAGLRVVLVDDGRAHHSGPYETLLAPTLRLLQRSGLAELVLPHASVDPLRHGAIWGSDAIAWRDDAGPGWLLHRGAFDAALRRAAGAAGVEVRSRARVKATLRGELELSTALGTERVLARCVVLATGRSSAPPLPRELVRADPSTMALTLVGEPHPADRGTAIVEAVPTGWIWTHAPNTGPASAAVLLDRAAVTADGASVALQAALAAAQGPAARLRGATVRHATDATARSFRALGDHLLIGDAAACIDPMASQGVEKALAAADHAAAVVATAVRVPQWWERLRNAHAQWEALLFAGHSTTAAQWYGREARFPDAAFWRQRRPTAALDAAPVSWDAPLIRSPQLAAQLVLVREGTSFVERAGVSHAATGEELSHVGYVSVQPLLDLFVAPSTLRRAVAAAGNDARLHVLSPHAVHTGLRALINRDWLIAAANAAGSP